MKFWKMVSMGGASGVKNISKLIKLVGWDKTFLLFILNVGAFRNRMPPTQPVILV